MSLVNAIKLLQIRMPAITIVASSHEIFEQFLGCVSSSIFSIMKWATSYVQVKDARALPVPGIAATRCLISIAIRSSDVLVLRHGMFQ